MLRLVSAIFRQLSLACVADVTTYVLEVPRMMKLIVQVLDKGIRCFVFTL
jgi:hypothetical protein